MTPTLSRITLCCIALLAAAPSAHAARCTGSDSCRACSNCSRCAHCSAGGSCGVCRGASSGRSSSGSGSTSSRRSASYNSYIPATPAKLPTRSRTVNPRAGSGTSHQPARIYVPGPESQERIDIVTALRPVVSKTVGQKVKFVFDHLKASKGGEGNYVFLKARTVEFDNMDRVVPNAKSPQGKIYALLQKRGGKWVVVDWGANTGTEVIGQCFYRNIPSKGIYPKDAVAGWSDKDCC